MGGSTANGAEQSWASVNLDLDSFDEHYHQLFAWDETERALAGGYRLGVVDEVLPEPLGGAHLDWEATATVARESLIRHLDGLRSADPAEMRRSRYEKFRSLGAFAGK